jgi:tetraacyldisaccharide 4'-kinase
LNQQAYRNLISGRSTRPTAVVLRLFLQITAAGYAAIIGLRNLAYSKSWLKVHTADVPVISIGNITTGGTGKTPLVIWLCKFLQQKNLRCAVLTRGYKTTQNSKLKTQNSVDEPAILAESCPQAKIIVNPNRTEAAAEAVNKFGAKVLIMDDGFQHRQLARNLDIVTIDATCPFGYGKLLPAGLLREPVASLQRADAAVITRCDQISESELCQIEKKLQLTNPDMAIAKSIHNPICVKSLAGEKTTIEQLKGKKIFAFCGIGNPDAFLNTIKNSGANLIGSKIYNDHYHYTDSDIDDIHGQANRLEADLILSTQKDHTHAIRNTQYDIPFAYLAVEIKFLSGEDKLKELIKDVLVGKMLKTKED